MTPLFFGPQQKLYGGYHAPEPGTTATATALVICQSIGHEYARSYRDCWQLAEAAAARNAHVLRFDYPGTGESLGDASQVDWQDWLDSVDTAIDWLQEATGVPNIHLLGLRLGAMIAAAASARQHTARRIVLVDPVIDGSQHVALMESLDAEQVNNMNRYEAKRYHYATHNSGEWLGFRWPAAIIEPLQQTRLMDIDSYRTDTWQLATTAGAPGAKLSDRVRARGGTAIDLPERLDWNLLAAQFRRTTFARSLPSLLDLAIN